MVSFNVAQYGGLDPAIRKIKPATGWWSGEGLGRLPSHFRGPMLAGSFGPDVFFGLPAIRMLDLRWREFHCARISMLRQPVDYRPAGIAQSEQLRNLVKSLSGRVVARVPDILVRPAFGALLRQIKWRVPA